jgi:stage V sporulation protein S
MAGDAVAAAAAPARRAPDDDTGFFRVGTGTNPQSLASAISHAVYDNKTPTLRAIGAGAISQAVKAVAIARGFVAPRGFDLAVIPGWATATGDRGDDLSAIIFRVVLLNHP